MSNDKSKIFRVLLVCTGNTCRSAMGHGILRELARQDNLEYLDVASAGMGTYDGYPASSNAVQAAAKDGVDIEDHHSTQLVADLMEESDLILAMAFKHYVGMRELYPHDTDKIFMLKAFPEDAASDEFSVADPIGLDYAEYVKTYDEIKTELKRILPYIKDMYNKKIRG